MTTLVTGFEPFGGSRVNPSELIAAGLAAREEAGVVAAVLPTSYTRSEARLTELLRLHRPGRVLLLGVADSAPEIRLEQVALNLDDCAAPDNDGDVRVRRRIIEGAPAAYWSSLPLESMARSARDMNENATFSRDAGGYVCNHAFFIATHLVATEFPLTRCGFVHVPAVAESSDRLERLRMIVQTWIAASVA
ncbi:MAG TPA: hypothetical protein VGQ35_04260 [Dongiaceae bacterium]|nr:hypothetical protein [Dongiaceae bacterium]